VAINIGIVPISECSYQMWALGLVLASIALVHGSSFHVHDGILYVDPNAVRAICYPSCPAQLLPEFAVYVETGQTVVLGASGAEIWIPDENSWTIRDSDTKTPRLQCTSGVCLWGSAVLATPPSAPGTYLVGDVTNVVIDGIWQSFSVMTLLTPDGQPLSLYHVHLLGRPDVRGVLIQSALSHYVLTTSGTMIVGTQTRQYVEDHLVPGTVVASTVFASSYTLSPPYNTMPLPPRLSTDAFFQTTYTSPSSCNAARDSETTVVGPIAVNTCYEGSTLWQNETNYVMSPSQCPSTSAETTWTFYESSNCTDTPLSTRVVSMQTCEDGVIWRCQLSDI